MIFYFYYRNLFKDAFNTRKKIELTLYHSQSRITLSLAPNMVEEAIQMINLVHRIPEQSML